MNPGRLRLGLLLDGFDVPAWAYRALELTRLSGCADFSLVILNKNSGATGRGNSRRKACRKTSLYRVYSHLDRRLFGLEPDPFAPKDVRRLTVDVPVLSVTPAHDRECQSFAPEDTENVKRHNLDILVKIGFEGLCGDVLDAARYGIWTWHRGSPTHPADGPAGFWEVMERRPVSSSALHVLAQDFKRRRVLCQSHYFTYPLSPARNKHYLFWASSSQLARQIESLHRTGAGRFFRQGTAGQPHPISRDSRQRGIPSNGRALGLMARMFARIVRETAGRAFCRDAWFLLFGKAGGPPVRPSEYKPIIPPRNRFWADPHLVTLDGRRYVFLEEYSYSKRKGHISVVEINGQGDWCASTPVLEQPYHLSYPAVFEWLGKYFMIPESGQNRTIDLYECLDFPHQWRHKMTLMDGVRAVDTTLFRHMDQWWLFTALAECEAAYPQVELFLYFSTDLFTRKWKPHPLNPIVSDIRRARPAGRIYSRDGRIYRPSQYCTTTYGYGFDLNEIVVLSETEYVERQAVSVRPDWDRRILATHTYACDGEVTLVDALSRRWRRFGSR